MDPLCDPMGDRVVKSVPPPPHKPMSEEVLYPYKGKFRAAKGVTWVQARTRTNLTGNF